MSIKPVFLFLVYVNVKDSDKKIKLFIPLPLMFLYFLIEDCIDMYEKKGQAVVIDNGHVISFVKEVHDAKI
jgi:hypothetical protein